MTRDELRERLIERAAEAEQRLYSRKIMTRYEREQAKRAIARALEAMDYDVGDRPAVRESAAIAISDRLK